MKVRINKNNEVIAFATIGDMPDSVEVKVPDGFTDNFAPGKYLLSGSDITINPVWVAPQAPKLTTTPSANQQMMMQLSQSVATLQSMVMLQNQQLAQLMTAKEEK